MIVIQTKSPLFSVIVPAYNSAAFIRTCVDSVLSQTCSDVELILVDDGSRDDTLSICQAYAAKDGRIRVIHKENGGHTSARNAGLQVACGEYVVFLDSDDWLSADTLARCREEITTHRCDVVIFRMQNSGDNHPFAVRVADDCYAVDDLVQSGASFLIGADGRFVFPKSLSGKCFRRDVIFHSQMAVPQAVLIGEDGAAFMGAMLKASTVSVIASDESACYWCLVRGDSVSRSADADAFAKAEILLSYYHDLLRDAPAVYAEQFNRYVVARLYTAALMVLRSGGGVDELNAGMDAAWQSSVIADGFQKAKFSLKGYKFILKKWILRHRLWTLIQWLDG